MLTIKTKCILIIPLLAGCYSPPRKTPIVIKPIDNRQPTEWVIEHREALERHSRSFFEVSSEYSSKSLLELEIDGRIDSCYYSYVPEQKRRVPVMYYDPYRKLWLEEWKQESQKLSKHTKSWQPEKIKLVADFTEAVLDVGNNGCFKFTLEVKQPFFAARPPDKPYHKIVKTDKEHIVRLTALEPPHGGGFYCREVMPKLWQYHTDDEKVKDFANGCIANISVRFVDKNSRRSVMPKVTVTAIKPSKDEVKIFFAKEFSDNRQLSDTAFESITGTVFNHASKVSFTERMDFKAWTSGEYKIEAIHGDYHYFSTIIKPHSNEDIRKEILLIEKGAKVSVEQVNEGSIGLMVDWQ